MFATLSLLAAVTVNMQAVPQRPAPRRAPVPPVVTVPVMPVMPSVPSSLMVPSAPELEAMSADLAELQGMEGLQGLAGLEGLAGLASLNEDLAGLQGLAALAPEGGVTIFRDRGFARTPREPWAAQDPGDSLYRAARQQLNRNRYTCLLYTSPSPRDRG